jgi:hypothetical protein
MTTNRRTMPLPPTSKAQLTKIPGKTLGKKK